MEHPNIARVLDAGATEAGRPFFVMELVRGVKITEFCDQGTVPAQERLALFIKVCQAIQHAHQKGIIHRDIKPSNILVTVNDGVPVPKVIDFGIAKATQGRLTEQTLFTAFEQFIGTPAYMSPEQAVLTSVDIDTRSDIYSLGVLLYELLTGRTPFDQKELLATGLEEMQRTIREKEPLPPSNRLTTLVDSELTTVARLRCCEPPRLVHFVRGDLDWIVMKCLEKERGRRYETANGLAMDVQRFLASEPIVARPPSRLYGLQKLVRRNKLVFGAASAVLGALVLGFSLSTWQYVEKSRAEREQNRLRLAALQAQANEIRLRREAEAAELAARKKAYASDMNLLQQALAKDDLARAQDLLNRQRPQAGQKDLRGWEWRYFWQFCQSDAAFTLYQSSNSITSVAFSPDGGFLAVGTREAEVSVWDLASRSVILRKSQPGERSARPAFAPAGSVLAFHEVSNEVSSIVLWDCKARREVSRLPLAAPLRDLAFSQDGRIFAADLGYSNNITIWTTTSSLPLARLSGRLPTHGMGSIFTVSPDGKRYAHSMYTAQHTVRVGDIDAGTETSLHVADEIVTALAFAEDGHTLITGSGYTDGAIKLWDIDSGQLKGVLEGHRSWVSGLKVLLDGKMLLSASADRTLRIWDLRTRRLFRTFRGTGAELWTADASSDGHWLASGGKDGAIVLWDVTSLANRSQPNRKLAGPGVDWWIYSPYGRWVGAIRSGRLQLYDATTLESLGEPNPSWTNAHNITFSSDGRRLVVNRTDATLCVWDIPNHHVVTNFAAAPASANTLGCVFLGGDTNLLTFGSDHIARVWDTTTWRELSSWPFGRGEARLRMKVNAVQAAIGTLSGEVELIQNQEPANRRQFLCQPRLNDLIAEGNTLAAASENGTVELWDIETRQRKALLHGVILGYHSVAISPDKQRLAAGSNGQEAVKLWDLESHEEVATLSGQGSVFTVLKFSPDGNTIGARNVNGVVHLWSAAAWKEIDEDEVKNGRK
jgi:WD40 repeat protein